MRSPSPSLPAEPLPRFVPAVIVAGALALAASALLGPVTGADPLFLLLFAVAAVPLFRFPYKVTREESIEVDEMLLVVMLPLLPPSAVASVLAAACLLSGFLRRVSPVKVLFNASTRALAGVLAATAVQALGFRDASGPVQALLAVGAAASYVLVTTSLVSRAVSLVTHTPFWGRFGAILRSGAGFWTVATGYGLLVASAMRAEGWTLPVAAAIAALVIGNSYRSVRDRQEGRRLSVLYDAVYRLNEAATVEEAEATLERIARSALGTTEVLLQADPPRPDEPASWLASRGAWLVLPDRARQPLTLEEQHLLTVMSSVADSAFQRLELLGELERQSLLDHLTGAHNRRYFELALDRLIARGRPFNLVLLDIDEFKRINDTHGHPTGDRVLIHLVRVARALFRDGDDLCRLGGDEFALLLPGLSPAQAAARLQELQKRLKEAPPAGQDDAIPPLAISVGVVAFPLHGRDPDRLLGAADGALYEAKRAGRDRIVTLADA